MAAEARDTTMTEERQSTLVDCVVCVQAPSGLRVVLTFGRHSNEFQKEVNDEKS